MHTARLPQDLSCRLLLTEPFVACLPSGHALARKRQLAAADLREQPLWWHDLDGQEKALVLALRRDPPPSTHELCHRLELSRSGLSRLRQRTRASIQQVLSRTQAA